MTKGDLKNNTLIRLLRTIHKVFTTIKTFVYKACQENDQELEVIVVQKSKFHVQVVKEIVR